MSIEVLFSPRSIGPVGLAGRTAIVIDILRATTTICAALHHGARAVVPTRTPDEARAAAEALPDDAVILAGEQDALPIAGFDAGNSPGDMTPDRVGGKTVVLCTTNGTGALLSARNARAIYPGAACNFSLLAALSRTTIEAGESLVLLCAGRGGSFGLDDAYCAGRLIALVLDQAAGGRTMLTDSARAAVEIARGLGARWDMALKSSRAGQDLERLGFGTDIDYAAREDVFPSLLEFRAGSVIRLAEAA